MARRKPMMGGMRGGMPMRDGMMGRGGKCQQYLLVLDYLSFTVFSSGRYLCDWNCTTFIQCWSS